MPIKTYRDPQTGRIYTEQGGHIPSLEDYQARVKAGELSGEPLDVSQMPKVRRTEDGGIESRTTLAEKLSNVDQFKSNAAFLNTAKDIIQRKQQIQQPLTEEKAYWRTLQRDTSPFGGMRDEALERPGMFTDERMRLLSPGEQASVRASRDAAASAHLQGIGEEERYRGTREEDLINSMRELLEEKRIAEKEAAEAASQAARDAATNRSRALDDRLKQLNIQSKLKELGGGYIFSDDGEIVRDYSSATAKDIAEAMKMTESGGDYNAVGDGGTSFGAYQYQQGTWDKYSSEYAKNVLQKSVRTLPKTPENQDAVTEWKIQQWLNQGYSPDQIAAAWNWGEGNIGKDYSKIEGHNERIGMDYSVPNHVRKVMGHLNNILESREPQEIEHKTWTPAAVRSLAEKLPNLDSTTLWNNYTDAELDALSLEVSQDIVGNIAGKLNNAALFRLGITKGQANEILSLMQMEFEDEEIKDMMKQLDINPDAYDELKEELKKLEGLSERERTIMRILSD